MAKNPRVFLSSVFADPAGSRLHIRDRVLGATGGASLPKGESRPIWMAEDYPELCTASPLGDLAKTELCLDGVRQAECFVAILTSRHGSSVSLPGIGAVHTSFFEAELFEAALLGKPSYIFCLEGYDQDDKLSNLLKLLAPAFPHMDLRPVSEDEIARRIERLLKEYGRPRWLRKLLPVPRLGRLVDSLFAFRHRPYDVASEVPPWRFLGGRFDPTVPSPDPAVVQSLLTQASATKSHQERLTLIWFAVRTLLGAPYTDPAYAALVPLWERVFRAWQKSAAWYGLHGPALLSCLASLGSLAEITAASAARSDPSRGLPHGSFASEYYSTAKLAGRSTPIFDLAMQHVDLAIRCSSGDGAGETAIRASIHLQMGHSDAALSDYARVVDLRKVRGGPAYGEALSELGFALLLAGHRAKGLDHMEEGLSLLKAAPASGFQVRAMRKLAAGYARCGKFGAALDTAAQAHDLADELGTRDQVGTLERFAKRLERFRIGRR